MAVIRKKTSPLKKNILYFISLFNYITLPIVVILFVVFILIDIPLKHLFGFIVVYTITKSISLIFDTDSHTEETQVPKRYVLLSLLGVNIITLVFLMLLVGRYELHAYEYTIYISAGVIMNTLFLEFSYHIISRFMKTTLGAWIGRTLLLSVGALIGILGFNIIQSTHAPTAPSTPPKKTHSEVTGVLSTIDPNIPVETTSSIAANGTDTPTNNIIGAATSPQSEPQSPTLPMGNEVTGTLTTSDGNVTINSIESLDGKATATLKDGKITVQVVDANTAAQAASGVTITEGWKIHSSIARTGGGGGLQGVVISAPVALPMAGTHANYQSIILTSDGASGIFFTIDGSDPSCDGKGMIDAIVNTNTITIKAISCFGGNRVRGPIASYTYTLGK